MKTLYISDLDGTLLNEKAEITEFTKNTINSLVKKGLFFTVATARTPATAVKMLEGLDLSVPGIFMNGVTAFDLKEQKYINTCYISQKGKEALFSVIEKYLHSGFVYAVKDNILSTYYENTRSPDAEAFIREREEKYGKKFTRLSSIRDCEKEGLVYYSIADTKEKLTGAYNELSLCDELHCEFYRDIYNTDLRYLEISAPGASKKNAVLLLKEKYAFDKIISFGDNLNDLPMFQVSDEKYAVMNAKDDIKEAADCVIGRNTENGVAEFLIKTFK